MVEPLDVVELQGTFYYIDRFLSELRDVANPSNRITYETLTPWEVMQMVTQGIDL